MNEIINITLCQKSLVHSYTVSDKMRQDFLDTKYIQVVVMIFLQIFMVVCSSPFDLKASIDINININSTNNIIGILPNVSSFCLAYILY